MEILLGSLATKGPYPYPGDQYLGEVLPAGLISGSELAAVLGITNGFAINDTTGWLKFKKQEGETILVAKRTFRYRLSWNQLEAAMAVFGDRLISIQGNTYKIRLLKGAEKDPSNWNTSMSQANPEIAVPSEWNRFIHRVAAGNPGDAESFVSFTLADLNIAVSATGRMTLCQETLAESANIAVARGNTTLTVFNYVNKPDGSASSTQDHYGWRPVLELVGVTKEYPGSGPGQKWLQYGDEQLGFFGEVPVSEMITNAQLKTHLGHAAGSVRADQGWLKFFYKGKVVFIGKNTYCSGLTWNALYAAGGIYGTNDNGKYPASTPANQYKPINWNSGGKAFKLIPRVMTCATDPFINGQDVLTGNEYSDLMGRVFAASVLPGSGQWARNTAAQVNMNVVHMGPETRGASTDSAAIRGYSGGTGYTSLIPLGKADASGYSQHFRMALEIEGDPNAAPPEAGPSFWLDPSDQPVDSTTIVDKSLKAINVTNSGVVVKADGPQAGVKSMFFDKASLKYLRMSGSAMPNALAKDFQIDFWFKADGVGSGTQAIIGQWAQSTGNDGFLINFNPQGQEAFNFGPYNANAAMITAAANPNRTNWVKYSMRRKGSAFEMWQDDVLVGSFTSALVATKTVDWIIGSWMNSSNIIPAAGSSPLGGWLADLRVYDYYKGAGNDNGFPYDRYIGEVAGADFITNQTLSNAIGITEGTQQHTDAGWLNFGIDGKLIWVAKRAFRYSVSWDHINSLGCVDGTKTVVIGGKTYKVRLLKGAEANPSAWTTDLGQDNPILVRSSEWNRLIMRVSASNPGPATNWASFSNENLNVVDGSGSRTHCMESIANQPGMCVGRGFSNLKWFNYSNKSDGPGNSSFINFGWRPVLELVP